MGEVSRKTIARAALAVHRAALEALQRQTLTLESAARLEEACERELDARADWEREVSLGPPEWGGEVTAVATWPAGDVLPKWLIGVGVKRKLLAVYEVTNYKGGRIASLLHYFPGEPPPVTVELEVYRRWGLRSPRGQ